MVKKMNKKVLIFTTTVRKNTSIGKFYGNLCEELNKSKINYKIIAIRDFNIKIPKIIEFLRLKDYYIAKKIDEIENINLDEYSLIFNDLGSGDGWVFKNLNKIKRKKIKIINLYRNSVWNYIDGYLKYGGILQYPKALFVLVFFVLLKEKRAVRFADMVYTVSLYSKNNLIKNEIDEKNVKVIGNAIETDIFKPLGNKKEIRKKLNLDENKFYLIFVGRFTFDKGREIIIETMKKLEKIDRNIELLLIDDKGYKEKLPSNIKYIGNVENEELPLWLNASDVFFFPSLYEGDSLACLEAASCGLPIMGSDTGGLWELKRNNEILSEFIIDIGSPKKVVDKYVEKILKLYENKELYNKVRNEWLKWGRKKDIKDNMKKYAEVITKNLQYGIKW